MAGPSVQDRIRAEFSVLQKEYSAFDRTLDALAALRTILYDVEEIKQETRLIDFRPRLTAADLDVEVYTPDGLIVLDGADFVLELKTSWNDKDINQIIKYAKSPSYVLSDDRTQPFRSARCVLLGYQNPPGEQNLEKLFDSWKLRNFGFPLVVFRYSLEQGSEGDRMYFSRVPYGRNGECPSSHLGKALNSPRGFPVSAESFKAHRLKFHKANDQVIASYAAVLWWTRYAGHYLSEEQKSEMAERGRLTSPLILTIDQIDSVPTPPDVEVPLGSRDVRRALEFLRQARLVDLKARHKVFEVELKEDRYIRLPQESPVPRTGSQIDISTKILARWASHKVKKPIGKPKKSKTRSARRVRDRQTGWLFDR